MWTDIFHQFFGKPLGIIYSSISSTSFSLLSFTNLRHSFFYFVLCFILLAIHLDNFYHFDLNCAYPFFCFAQSAVSPFHSGIIQSSFSFSYHYSFYLSSEISHVFVHVVTRLPPYPFAQLFFSLITSRSWLSLHPFILPVSFLDHESQWYPDPVEVKSGMTQHSYSSSMAWKKHTFFLELNIIYLNFHWSVIQNVWYLLKTMNT